MLLSIVAAILALIISFVFVARRNVKVINHYYINGSEITKERYNQYFSISSKNINVQTRKQGSLKIVEYNITTAHYLYQLMFNNNIDIDILKAIRKEGKVNIALTDASGKVFFIDNKPVERKVIAEDLYWALIANAENIKLMQYENCHFAIASEIFDFSEAIQKRQNVGTSFVVRWVGAYNTQTTKKTFGFSESFDWETSPKEREVAGQILSSTQELIENTNSPINPLDFVEVGVMYSSEDVAEAYNIDVFSRSIGPVLMPGHDSWKRFNQFDKIKQGLHSEAFIALNAVPKAIVVRQHIEAEKLEVVINIANKKGLEIIFL